MNTPTYFQQLSAAQALYWAQRDRKRPRRKLAWHEHKGVANYDRERMRQPLMPIAHPTSFQGWSHYQESVANSGILGGAAFHLSATSTCDNPRRSQVLNVILGLDLVFRCRDPPAAHRGFLRRIVRPLQPLYGSR